MGKNEPVCIADEVPFEIPESWEWVRLGEIFQHNTGKALNASNRSGELLTYITTSNLYWNRFEVDSLREMYFSESEVEKCTAVKGDLLVCEGGDIGRAAIWPYNTDIRIQNHIHRLRAYVEVCTEYYYYIFFLYKHAGWIGGKGIGIKGLSSNALHSLIFPLPPLHEQQRIVTKLKMLEPFFEKYTQVEKRLNNLNVQFPDLLKKSILQDAVQGKLVPQDSADEPASILLERIRAEKQRLIAERKIKKDKHESVIFRRDNSHYEKLDGIERCIDDEIPFEIPESWEWVRFYNIASFQNGDRSKNYPNRNEYVSNGVAWINTGHITSDGFLNVNTMNYITEEKYNSLSNGHIQKGDLVYCLRGATFGKVARIEPFPKGAIASSLMIIRPFDVSLRNYIYWYLRSPSAYTELHKYSNGSAQPNLAAKDVGKYLVPVPPLDEQIRIINESIRLLEIIENI